MLRRKSGRRREHGDGVTDNRGTEAKRSKTEIAIQYAKGRNEIARQVDAITDARVLNRGL